MSDRLRAIAGGSRDRSLTGDPELHYILAAELLLLIDTLEAAAAGPRTGEALAEG